MNNMREWCIGAERKNRVMQYLNDRAAGRQLYLLAFTVFLFAEALSTTMFPIPGRVLLLMRGLALLGVLVKMILYDRLSVRAFWISALLLCLGLLIAAASGYKEPFFWIGMILGARGVPWKKILQIYLIISVSIVLLAFCASMLGVIENLQYTRENTMKMRNSFGIIYTTDFASHIFSALLVFFYLMKEKARIWHYAAACVLACLVYRFCYTRLDVGCIFLMIVLFLFLNLHGRRRTTEHKYRSGRKLGLIFCLPMPVLALMMWAASRLYRDDSSIMVKADTLASGRLALGNAGLNAYGISPFGQFIEMVGNGGSVTQIKEYFFIDCSYLYILLCYGAVFFLVVLAAYMLCCRKMAGDHYYIAAVIVISINCMIAHHLIELAYNPFVLALLADAAIDTRPGSSQMLWNGRYAGNSTREHTGEE